MRALEKEKKKNNGGGYVSYPPSSKKYLEQALTLSAWLGKN